MRNCNEYAYYIAPGGAVKKNSKLSEAVLRRLINALRHRHVRHREARDIDPSRFVLHKTWASAAEGCIATWKRNISTLDRLHALCIRQASFNCPDAVVTRGQTVGCLFAPCYQTCCVRSLWLEQTMTISFGAQVKLHNSTKARDTLLCRNGDILHSHRESRAADKVR